LAEAPSAQENEKGSTGFTEINDEKNYLKLAVIETNWKAAQ